MILCNLLFFLFIFSEILLSIIILKNNKITIFRIFNSYKIEFHQRIQNQ